MVAEPVQATLQTLSYFFDQSSDFIATQHEKIVHSGYVEKISQLNPFASDHDAILDQKYHSLTGPRTSILDKLLLKVSKNRKVLTVLTLGLGTGGYLYWKHLQLTGRIDYREAARTKRRAPKLLNGARRDVVLVIGSPTEPLTRLIALDFEKRGLIVYLTILDEKDFKFVESNPITDDINYLNLNDDSSIGSQIVKFQQLLELPVIPFPGAQAHTLRLVSVVFTPSLYFPIGPIENMSVNTWYRINDRISKYLNLFSSGLVGLIRNQASKTILINPNIISTLNMPYHSPEVLFQNTMKHLFTALTREISPHGLSVTQIRLGNLHLSNQNGASGSKIANMVNSEIRSWDPEIKEVYGDTFSKTQYRSNPIRASGGRGTSLRELYHLLFDLSYGKGKNSAVLYCGSGARSYDLIAHLLPESWIDCFLR